MLDRLRRFPLAVVLIALTLAAVTFWTKGHIGLSLADEGFLWYGTLHTALGEVPIRDFQSYDPGRYYWGALWFKVLRSNGTVALVFSYTAFEFIGLCLGLLVLRGRVLRKWWALAIAGFVLWCWMSVHEPTIILAAIYFAVLLVERPSIGRHFLAGVFVGLAGFFGRNLGLYTSVAFAALILFIWWRIEREKLSKRLGIWLLGVVVGYLPMLAMMVFVHGFLHAVIEAVWFNLTVATRLPLPVPWPWRGDYAHMNPGSAARVFAIGMLYLLVPISYFLALIYLLKTKADLQRKSVLIASAFVGIVFLHYTFSRASLSYMLATIGPVLISLMALPVLFPRFRKMLLIGVWAGIIIVSRVTIWEGGVKNIPVSVAINAIAVKRYQGSYDLAFGDYGWVRTRLASDDMWLPASLVKQIDDVRDLVQQKVAPDESILIAPHWTTFYPILGRKSPVWEIYFLFPQSKEKQEGMIADMRRNHTNWAITCDYPLDERDELRFSRTHSYMWQDLLDNFETVPADAIQRPCLFWHRKEKS